MANESSTVTLEHKAKLEKPSPGSPGTEVDEVQSRMLQRPKKDTVQDRENQRNALKKEMGIGPQDTLQNKIQRRQDELKKMRGGY